MQQSWLKKGLVCGIALTLFGGNFINIYSSRDRSDWSISTVPTQWGVYGLQALALDSNGYPHIAYVDYEYPYMVVYAKWTGSSWSNDQFDYGTDADIVLDSNNLPRISYYKDYHLWYAQKLANGNWLKEAVDTTSPITGYDSSIALDSGGNPHISYCDYTYGDVRYAKKIGSSWTSELVQESSNVNRWRYTSLVLDSTNSPHISYYDTFYNDLRYAKKIGGSWNNQVVDSSHCGGYETSIDVGSNDYPHITYYDGTSQDLRYIKGTGSSWTTPVIVDSAGDVGRWSALKLDSTNRPHISYQDRTNEKLKYATFIGSWQTESVDTVGVFGGFTSLDVYGTIPCISYYVESGTNRQLKYAKYSPATTPPVADFVCSPQNPVPSQTVAFNAASSHDPDGGSITLYEWDWNNDGNYEESHTSSTATHSWSLKGRYPVTLRVTDDESPPSTDTETKIMQVGVPPIADFTFNPDHPIPNQAITFNAASSSDPDGTINWYRWDWTSNGNYEESYYQNPTATHSYASSGRYTVTLEVEDDDGLTDEYLAEVVIEPAPPVVHFIWTPLNPIPSQTINFDGSSSYDPDGSIIWYRWDWTNNGEFDYISHEPTATNSYPTSGSYTVGLQVEDNDGNTNYTCNIFVLIGDLNITQILPIQVILNPTRFVVNKKTVVRINITSTFNEDVTVPIKIIYNYGEKDCTESVRLKSGENWVYLPGGPSSINPIAWEFGKELVWTSPGTEDQLKVIVDPSGIITENNENNNEKPYEKDIDFIETENSYTILYQSWKANPVVFFDAGVDPSDCIISVSESNDFIHGTFPLEDDSPYYRVVTSPRFGPGVLPPIIWIIPIDDLRLLGREGTLSGYDRTVGIASKTYFDYFFGAGFMDVLGYGNPLISDAVLIQNGYGYWVSAAHEIHHTYGGWRTGNGEEYKHYPGNPAWGFWVDRHWIKGSYPEICFMGAGGSWICDECYEHLLDTFQVRKSKEKELQKIILLSGFIDKNDTVKFDNMYVLENRSISDIPSGNYKIKLYDEDGQLLDEIPINVSFWLTIDPYGAIEVNTTSFVFKIPYPETKSSSILQIQMTHNDTILAEQNISAHSPTLHLTSLNAGENLSIGSNYTISWDGEDIDGDTLNYSVLFSSDNGENWIPLIIETNKTEYLMDTTYLEQSDFCKIKVIATDGFNTAIDESNETFSLHLYTVYIDDNYTNTTYGWQRNRFNIIQDGINALENNGTVYVLNGTYAESPMINKTIDFIGENMNTTIIENYFMNINADSVRLTNLTIRNSDGIYVSSNHNKFTACSFIKNFHGIMLISSINTTIKNCIIATNNIGINAFYGSNYNEISNCTIFQNTIYGIYLGGWYNTIRNCNIINNRVGIYAHWNYSNMNYIFNNNFNNTQNARDDIYSFWDDGYPIGGNYWNNYVGVDLFHGQNQNIPGSDGIGDTPYNIPGWAHRQDRYPLMSPWRSKLLFVSNISNKWNFISSPFNYSVEKTNLLIKYNGSEWSWQEAVNQSIVLGFIYGWNRTTQNYELINTLNPGDGYWIYAYHNCELLARCVSYLESDSFITNLLPNWSIMGLPDDEPIEKQNLTILYNETMYSWQEAVTNNIILGFIYQWNETNQNYQLTDILQPGKSYWMYAYYNCTLLRPTI